MAAPTAPGTVRVAAWCVGVQEYTYLDDMEGATRDAEAFNVRLNATPGCSSALTKHNKVTASSKMLLRAVRARLQELSENPPELFLMYFAGHTVQLASKWGVETLADTKTYLVPAGANPKREADCDEQCLGIDKLLNVLRKDLCAPVRARTGKSVVFLLLLDSVRRVLAPDGGSAMDRTCNVTSPTSPHKTAIFAAHLAGLQRKVVCEDREQSTFLLALLDSQAGVFAQGISIARVLSKLACCETGAASVGFDAIPTDFCIVPAEVKLDLDEELRALLGKWKLDDQAHLLAAHGVLSLADLESMTEEDVDAFGLSIRFRALLPQFQKLAALRVKDKKKNDKNQQGSGAPPPKSQDSGAITMECDLDSGNPDGDDFQQDGLGGIADLWWQSAEALLNELEHLEEARDVLGIVRGMEQFIQNVDVQEMCSWSIWFLAADDDLQALIASDGGVEAILTAMRAHPLVAAVQEAACAALSNLAHYQGDNQVLIAGKGGIECLVEAMKVHSGLQKLQEHACATLANLASNTAVDNGKIVEAGGVERIVSAMTAHTLSPRIQEQGCAALSSMATVKEHQTLIVWAGGIERTVAAMHEHKVPEVQQAACFAIRSLSLNSTANQISVVKAGGLERLNAALNSLAPLVQKAACAALMALSSCVSIAEKIRLSGAPASLRNMITAPDVSKDAKRLGEQLLGRLESDASSGSSPLASPIRGTSQKMSPENSVFANGRDTLPSERQLRRRPGLLEDCEPLAGSPKHFGDGLLSSPSPKFSPSGRAVWSPKGSRRLSLDDCSPKGSRRLALDDNRTSARAPWSHDNGDANAEASQVKKAIKLLKLPQVEGRTLVAAKGGGEAGIQRGQVISRTLSSLQNAGNKAREVFTTAGWYSALPFVGSGGTLSL